MSKLTKIKQTKKATRSYTNPLVNELKRRTITRSELAYMLNTSDAMARQEVSEISMFYPVLSSSSSSKGYTIAKDINSLTAEELSNEIENVQRTLNEHLSRIKALKKKCKPLIAYLKVAESKQKEKENGE